MKKYPKFLVILSSILCIALCLFGILGYSTKYGDITSKLAENISGADAGIGYENTVDMIYSFKADANETELTQLKKTLERRLVISGVKDYQISVNKDNKQVSVLIPWGSRSSIDVNSVYSALAITGKLEIREGEEKNDDGSPAGITAANLIATNDGLREADGYTEMFSGYCKEKLTLKFKGQTKNNIKQYTETALKASNGEVCIYSVWVDGTLLNSLSFTKVIENGKVEAGDISYTSSSKASSVAKYYQIGTALSGGALPFALKGENVLYLSEPNDSVNYLACISGIGVMCILCAVYWIVRYKLLGAAAFISLCGYTGILCMFVSGSFFSAQGIFVSKLSLSAFATATAAVILLSFHHLESISGSLRVQSAFKACQSVLKNAGINALKVLVILLAVSSITYLTGPVWIFTLLHAITVSALCALIFMIWIFKLNAKCLSSFEAFKSEKFFGGNAK